MAEIYRQLVIRTKKEDGKLVHSVEKPKGVLIDEPLISAQKRFNEEAYAIEERRAGDNGQRLGDLVSRVEYLVEDK